MPLFAEVTTEMSFRNDERRVLEGALEFTLPQEAAVCGYALDIDGAMVEGVVVEKQAARIAFEKEVRKGVDPGLAELVAGNIFKTRVYPVFPKETRTVRVVYQTAADVDGAGNVRHTVPVAFANKLDRLRVQVLSQNEDDKNRARVDATGPQVPDGTDFERARDGSVFDFDSKKVSLKDGDSGDAGLTFTLPKVAAKPLLALEVDPTDSSVAFFALNYVPSQILRQLDAASNSSSSSSCASSSSSSSSSLAAVSASVSKLLAASAATLSSSMDDDEKREKLQITLLWDASLSRSQQGKADGRFTELDQLLALFGSLGKTKDLTVNFVPFRDVPDACTVFTRDSKITLKTVLSKLAYDGGTNFTALFAWLRQHCATAAPDACILCSDGLDTMGVVSAESFVKDISCPLFAFNGAGSTAPANAAFLRFLAESTGGQAFFRAALLQGNSFGLAEAILTPQLQFLHARGKDAFDVHPSTHRPIADGGRFLITGKVRARTALKLSFGLTAPTQSVTLDIDPANATAAEKSTGIVARLWAQQRLGELGAFADANKAAILACALRFSIATRHTSFLVCGLSCPCPRDCRPC